MIGYNISLPEWAVEELARLPECIPSLKDRMAEVIRFSRLNFEHDTGGPFAAGIFEKERGRVITIGVNRVVPSNCSSAHGEIVALSIAQSTLGVFDLGESGLPAHQMVVNWRPCAMCFGAVPWSGIRSLVIAGSGSELEELTGFDEGPIHPNWKTELESRGIEVIDGLMTEEACEVFRVFGESDRIVYNGRLG